MVNLKFFRKEDLPEVSYTLDKDQAQYTYTADQALKRIKERNDLQAFPVTIFQDDHPAGFFVLDFGEDKFDLTDNRNAVLLRSLSVNPDLQGKGVGKSAMLKIDDFIRENFKDCDEIVLAVNHNNMAAYDLYIKTGYKYEGRSRMGRNGPQYLMYKKL